MDDVWIYAGPGIDGELAPALAELGLSPRRIEANGSLLPSGTDAARARRPVLAVVCAAPGEAPPEELLERLSAHDDLCDVPVLAAVDSEHLSPSRALRGVADLLVRPFTAQEVHARVIRVRTPDEAATPGGELVRVGSLELNLATYQVSIRGEPVSFTYMEYELLKFLVTHPNRVFSREALLSAVWGYDYYGGARTVDVHVRRVRAKLGQEHAGRIKTVRSVGYRFQP